MLSWTGPRFRLERPRNCLIISANGWQMRFFVMVEIMMAYFKFFMVD